MMYDNNIWLTSDWHLFHKNIHEYEGRPIGFEQQIIKNIIKTVGWDDVVINLGDVIFGPQSKLTGVMAQLPGKHYLTLGNHDRNKPKWYVEHGFHWAGRIYEYKDILFSHVPRDMKLFPHLKYNIHGHFHTQTREEKSRTKEFHPFYSDNHFLLSLEELNYEPRLLNDYLNELPSPK